MQMHQNLSCMPMIFTAYTMLVSAQRKVNDVANYLELIWGDKIFQRGTKYSRLLMEYFVRGDKIFQGTKYSVTGQWSIRANHYISVLYSKLGS